MSDWFIQKSGFSSDKVVGPLTSEQVIALFSRGEVKKKTPLVSQQHTNNEWMEFGQTVLWQQAQDAIRAKKKEKEQSAAAAIKKQEQERLQLQQLQEEEKAAAANRKQQPVAVQPVPTPGQVSVAVSTSNQQFPPGQSTYRKTVNQRFEASNSILDLFDWKFEKYVTPLIIRITWIIVVAVFLIAAVYYMVGPRVWAEFFSGPRDSSDGPLFQIPVWVFEIYARILVAVMMMFLLLWVRVLLESMIVIFNIAQGVSNIERIKEKGR